VFEKALADVKAFYASVARTRAELVVSENRRTAREQFPERRQGRIVLRFDAGRLARLEDEREQVGDLLMRKPGQEPFGHERLALALKAGDFGTQQGISPAGGVYEVNPCGVF